MRWKRVEGPPETAGGRNGIPKVLTGRAIGVPILGMVHANAQGMTIELVSEAGDRSYKMRPKAFGKLLHMARLHGWHPERVPHAWPSDSWETEIILPHLGPYMPGRVSRADAEGLRMALTRALPATAPEGASHHSSAR